MEPLHLRHDKTVPKVGHPVLWLGEVLCGDGVFGFFGLPDDLDHVPLLAVVDGLDAIDAAVSGLGVVADAGFVGAPEMSEVGPRLGLDVQLVLSEHGAAALRDRVDPAVDVEDDRGGCAIGGDADWDEARVGQKERAEAGSILVCGTGDRGVDGGDELIERGGGRAGCSWCWGLRCGRLGAEGWHDQDGG